MANVSETLDQRHKMYGDYRDVAKISQLIKMVFDVGNTGRMSHVQRESLDMIATKIARIASGDPDTVDHWLDIEGYARLVRNILEREND